MKIDGLKQLMLALAILPSFAVAAPFDENQGVTKPHYGPDKELPSVTDRPIVLGKVLSVDLDVKDAEIRSGRLVISAKVSAKLTVLGHTVVRDSEKFSIKLKLGERPSVETISFSPVACRIETRVDYEAGTLKMRAQCQGLGISKSTNWQKINFK